MMLVTPVLVGSPMESLGSENNQERVWSWEMKFLSVAMLI